MEHIDFICREYSLPKSQVIEKLHNSGYKVKPTVKQFPWDGTVCNNSCQGLKYCDGLFVQCHRKRVDVAGSDEFCVVCSKQAVKNSNGKPTAGTVADRKACGLMDYVDSKNRKVMPYSRYIKKHNIDKDLLIVEAKIAGIVIAEAQFASCEIKRGRPKGTRGNKKKEDENDIGRNSLSEDHATEDADSRVDNDATQIEEPDTATENNEEEEEKEGEEEDDDEEEECEEFTVDGVTYYKNEQNILYNLDGDPQGYWNEEFMQIDPISS